MNNIKYFLFLLIITVSGSCQQSVKKDPPKQTFTSPKTPDFIFTPLTQVQVDYYKNAAEDYYEKHLKHTGFSGDVYKRQI